MKNIALKLMAVLLVLFSSSPAWTWHDQTHLTLAKVAGLKSWYNAAGPDLAKIKAGNVESYNHWFNNNTEAEVTTRMVLDQIERYDKNNIWWDTEGHIYGAIIASLAAYEKDLSDGKYAQYHLAYCAHYMGDLSQPLHNIRYDLFNQSFHSISDGIVENTLMKEPEKITRHMYAVILRPDNFEEDLASEIARIANITRKLGYKLRAENRNITKEEAYVQLGHSASLLKAVLRHYNH
ncbi:MAG: hypothetical protein ABFD45_00780 [Smithella sp.]|jgi:hypothetical protein